ncbi:hypothetical protein BU16DRAFT_595010 [Lophium mytilinum]|uniref:F-box domain-containing protein n=1 Tax=Lophium mytilinum TaxID=390894 RepID=A0A6A6QIG8_9PEZI|nr:hypothetical protein BU16DRAFT_595010 [Lophium mytilinum]
MASLATQKPPSPLLSLPLELQLSIYELALISPTPLLLNLPCNSSYRSRSAQETLDAAAWAAGTLHAPSQPPLTRVCHALRRLTLPIFYGENVFRARYCTRTEDELAGPVAWLRAMGPANREMLRWLVFYDRNERHDKWTRDWEKVEEGPVVGELGGRVETVSDETGCAHLVRFGEGGGRGRMPEAVRVGPGRLRLEGEV